VVVTSVQVAREQKDGDNVLAIQRRYDVIATHMAGNNVIFLSIEQSACM